jgi:molybdopterin/thiamine biosynthesis adenylyltransferase
MAEGGDWQERFSRQIVLPQLGEEGQMALGKATIVIVGAGGLGSTSAETLVRMGVGHVRVIDPDVVELSNLHRVRAYGESDVGRPKVQVLAERLTGLIEGPIIEPVRQRLDPTNALALLKGADVVLDGLDNMGDRYLVNDACLELDLPWVYGGVVATGGLVAPFMPGGPCLRCLFPEPAAEGALPTTATAGIHPSLPALVSAVQVAQATRIVLGQEEGPNLLAMDMWSDDWRVVGLSRRQDCPACVGGRRDFLRGDLEG